MAPGPRKSDAIDKPDPRAPHIILRTLPALSFSTPTHSIHLQLAFRPPARDKLCPMAETSIDSHSLRSSTFGGQRSTPPPTTDGDFPRAPSRSSDPLRELSFDDRVRELVRHHATKGDIAALSSRIDDLSQTMTKQNAQLTTDVESSDAKITALEVEVKAMKTEIGGLRTDVTALQTNVYGLQKDVKSVKKKARRIRKGVKGLKQDYKQSVDGINRNMVAINDTLRLLVLALGVDVPVPQAIPIAMPVDESSSSESPSPSEESSKHSLPIFTHSDPPSPTDLLLVSPVRPSIPSPSLLSPISPTDAAGDLVAQGGQSSRSLRSQSSQRSLRMFLRNVGTRLDNTVSEIKHEGLELLRTMRRDAPPVPPLPQSPQEATVSGPSTEAQLPAASKGKGKLRLQIGQPIQPDRQ